MKTPLAFGGALLVSTFLGTSGWAQVSGGTTSAPSTPVQSTPATPTTGAGEQPGTTSEPGPDSAEPVGVDDQGVEISIPGSSDADSEEIVVIGRNIPEPVRATAQVISVLSTDDIARTGEGDIAGALQRVTGLSVVGQGFVYVRGLGDRYSLSLLNGSPLPSPEPLRRVVPLDIFPSRIVASALVQKTFSPNYPGEFGGGVINLTTIAVPDEDFLDIGISGGIDTESTAKLGYTYYGGDLDVLGYDDGTRSTPGFIRAAGAGNSNVGDLTDVARLSNSSTTVLQRNSDIPANFGADLSFGAVSDWGAARIGAIASAGYSSTWQTRDSLQQSTRDVAGQVLEQFRVVQTDNRVLVNGLIGLGVDLDEHKLRLTTVYIHDTVKEGRLASGYNIDFNPPGPGEADPLIEQNTLFFERQLYDIQGVGELRFGDLSVDLRGTYARTNRDSPYERSFGYIYNSAIGDYQNRLTQSLIEGASIAFSELKEDVYAGGLDLGYALPTARPIRLTGGYAYTETDRVSTRYTFLYQRRDGLGLDGITAQLRPDFLLSDLQIIGNPTNSADDVILVNRSGDGGASRYDASLQVHAGYGMFEAEVADGLRVTGGVRYEQSDQRVVAGTFDRLLSSDTWLPAATVTWNFADDMQLRLHGSKTIARPQFRELAPQLYLDFTSDRQFFGNPFLENSELYNAEARYEWFFRRDERVTIAGFFKRLENPIEAVAFFTPGGQLQTGFSNAPRAQLYGGEIEAQKYVPLYDLAEGFANKRLVLIANYTYTQSELQIDEGDQAIDPILGAGLQPQVREANLLFQNGAPLTGQSDHLVNLQIGIEDTERLSQATLLFTYASDRVTNRGPVESGVRLPDLRERPGIRLDFVAREAVEFLGTDVNLKFEARNLTGTRYSEFQSFEAGQVFVNRYDLGRVFSLGASVSF